VLKSLREIRAFRVKAAVKEMVTLLRVEYPSGKRFAACITFDFDTFSVWIGAFKQPTPTPISRGEFGVVGVERILEILKKYSVPATWFIPGYDAQTHPDLVRKIHSSGHEIGHHGYLHETPVGLTLEEERKVIRRGTECLFKITGEKPKGYRSPAWDLSANTVDLLLQEGFAYDSSMMAHDYLPYKVRKGDVVTTDEPFKFGQDTELVEVPVYWGLDDYPHFEFIASSLGSGLKAGSGVLENWINDFEYMCNNVPGGIYNICFHPFITGRGHRLILLEKLIQHIKSKGDVWFARMIDVVNACK
jgi:peptidoglycan/xylan/chitin deacetylase (PgdA/CDA1 family)